MARTPNSIPTRKLQLSTTPQVVEALEALMATGKFGKSKGEVAEELLRLKLREIELEGWLEASSNQTGTRSGGGSSRRPKRRAGTRAGQ